MIGAFDIAALRRDIAEDEREARAETAEEVTSALVLVATTYARVEIAQVEREAIVASLRDGRPLPDFLTGPRRAVWSALEDLHSSAIAPADLTKRIAEIGGDDAMQEWERVRFLQRRTADG